jgi:hypothetical protein
MITTCVLPRLELRTLLGLIDQYHVLPLGTLERAAMAVYLDRRKDAERALAVVDDPVTAEILTAEFAILESRHDDALAALERLPGTLEPDLAARVAWNRCRYARMRRDWHGTERHASEAVRLARLAGDDALHGCALTSLGIAYRELGHESAATERAMREAVALLRSSEDLKFRAYAESTLATWLLGGTGSTEAYALLRCARDTFERYGLRRDLEISHQQYAMAELQTGRYDDALAHATSSGEAALENGDMRNYEWALRIATLALTFLERYDEAVARAGVLADMCSGEDGPRGARILMARARARAGDRAALDELEDISRDADLAKRPIEAATIAVQAADALLSIDVPRAFRARDEIEQYRALRGQWINAEFRQLDARWSAMPIRREGSSLIVDTNGAALALDDARTILNDVLTRGQTDERPGALAERRGLTYWGLWDLRKFLDMRLGALHHGRSRKQQRHDRA